MSPSYLSEIILDKSRSKFHQINSCTRINIQIKLLKIYEGNFISVVENSPISCFEGQKDMLSFELHPKFLNKTKSFPTLKLLQ